MENSKKVVLCIGLAMLLISADVMADVQIDYFHLGGAGGPQAFIVRPSQPAAGMPWVWYAPTLAGVVPGASNDWYFQRLLNNGIAVAGVDVGESYGSPAGRAVYSDFYNYATTQGNLASKVCLLAQSRGGLMMYNWAAENSEKVSAIVGIYPVCDLRSYPGLARAAPAYGMTATQLALNLSEHNPIDRLSPLAAADIPVYHVHGDSDTVVPLSANSQVIYDRYHALGGRMELVVIPGKGHEEVPEFFQSQELLDFMVASVPEPDMIVMLAILGVFTLAVCIWRKIKMSRTIPLKQPV